MEKVYTKLNSIEEFFEKHAETEQLVMMLQGRRLSLKNITAVTASAESMYALCLMSHVIRITCVMWRVDFSITRTTKQMEDIVLRICQYLGYDFNTVELAVRWRSLCY